MFNAFEELFSPGRGHTRDEQNRLDLTREDVGDADPGRGPIDLVSGRVVVRAAEPDPAEEGPTPPGEGPPRGDTPPGEGPAGEQPAVGEKPAVG
ncbi:DUF6191 domain-containing protein [Streptomyces sp. NBC_00199]|uniref:DUF6191 domain-containing protein n=1 Tax=Streptomyces sp. NBC_00199 TaxID=2975678 RepID=UPI002254D6E0|nr:DUF6191 domain-containing protein [Streptomyces sp. NBC_00199]MCX5267885.1 DUF6191 domain-containing protein [Streptomyces sp. NBC_00199]